MMIMMTMTKAVSPTESITFHSANGFMGKKENIRQRLTSGYIFKKSKEKYKIHS